VVRRDTGKKKNRKTTYLFRRGLSLIGIDHFGSDPGTKENLVKACQNDRSVQTSQTRSSFRNALEATEGKGGNRRGKRGALWEGMRKNSQMIYLWQKFRLPNGLREMKERNHRSGQRGRKWRDRTRKKPEGPASTSVKVDERRVLSLPSFLPSTNLIGSTKGGIKAIKSD